MGSVIGVVMREELHRYTRIAKITGQMIELEIYAPGLRETGKILELDRQLVETEGLRYKLDTKHDIVYLELDEPTLSVREIRAIFVKLGLQPLFIGTIPSELQSRTKTEPLDA